MCNISEKKKERKNTFSDAFDLLKLNGAIKMESKK